MSTETQQHQKLTVVQINGKDYELIEGKNYTGAELKAIGGVPPGETLFLEQGQGHERPISDTETVKIHPHMRFESSPDGGVS
jgi:hypothetical protein